MNYLSVCSGIEAATVAWHDMGWNPVGFSEIEKFPSEVLAHHYPNVPNLGDMSKYNEWNLNDSIGLLVGGTPCQSFSVAGLRKGMDDPRGNLALIYLGIANKFRPKWIVWENVPGVLSSNGGRDFGSFLGALVKLGYGFSYRVLDAQYFGVAQRRRRVFVVGCLGDWRGAAAVLFEQDSCKRDIEALPKRFIRGEGKNLTGCLSTRVGAYDRQDLDILIYDYNKTTVRNLIPVECERLQGFPDNYTNIENATKAKRYKTLGNSMAVPVMKWIGKRINELSK
jgi:DNA (cytosine-5)-methyltransferase 1